VTIEATGSRDKLEALLRVLEPFGIRSWSSPGMVALGRGRARSPTAPCARSPP
jgi:acetolactate synthase I/III small subunit